MQLSENRGWHRMLDALIRALVWLARIANATGTLDPIVLQALEAGWFRFEYKPGEQLPAAAQMINGEWWCPRFGCDSLEHTLDMMQNREISCLWNRDQED